MAAGKMFTAFDITLELQKRRMRKPHREIRRDIKRVADNLMWRFGYERTLINFEEVRASAFVYHPYGTDASWHQPSIRLDTRRMRNNQKLIADARVGAHTKAGQDREDDSGVPASVAQALGLNAEGNTGVFVDLASSYILIIKHSDLDIN
jgi:hypothetical protein